MPEVSYPQGGAANWSNGYLPAFYQGTPLRPTGSPILDLQPPEHVTPDRQRRNLDLLARMNQRHAREHPEHEELSARLASYELAFRMQTEVPVAIDLSGETQKTLSMYGIGNAATDAFGRKCLLARKMVEKASASCSYTKAHGTVMTTSNALTEILCGASINRLPP